MKPTRTACCQGICCTFLLVFFMVVMAPAAACRADDAPQQKAFGLELGAGLQVAAKDHFLDRSSGRLERYETEAVAVFSPGLWAEPSGGVRLEAAADLIVSHDLEGNEDDEVDEADARLTAAFLEVDRRPLRLRLGMQPVAAVGGWLWDDDRWAATVCWRSGPFAAAVQGVLFQQRSPAAAAAVTWRPDGFSGLRATAAWLHDGDDALAELLPRLAAELDLESRGDLYWAALDAWGPAGPLYLKARVMGLAGTARLDHRSGGRSADLEGWSAEVSAQVNLGSWTTVGGFIYLASGDDTPGDGKVSAFIQPAAARSRAALFFDPDFADRDDEGLAMGGVFAAGVTAPGLTVELAPADDWLIQAQAAWLLARHDATGRRGTYGWEADLSVQKDLGPDVLLFSTLAWFEPGDFFELAGRPAPDPAYLWLAGIQMRFE